MSIYNGDVRMFYTRPSDQQTYCFVPVPLLSESSEVLRTGGSDSRIAVIRSYTFNGTLLPALPALSGVPDAASCIQLLDRKSDQLKSALSEDRGDLLVVDGSGYPIISDKPLVTDLSFEEGTLVQQRKYSVTFEVEEAADSGNVREYSNNWSFTQNEDDTIAVTHTVNAVGIPVQSLNRTSLDSAKLFVLSRIGMDKTQSSIMRTPYLQSLVDVDNLGTYNKVYSETIDEPAGSYEIQETYVLASGAFLDDRTIDKSFSPDGTGRTVQTTTINGTVKGYGNTTVDKYNNAVVGFETFVSPQINFDTFSTRNRSDNRIAGTVTYSITDVLESGVDESLEERSISRSFDRNEQGFVTQTVTTSARVREASASGIESAINFCFANNYPINSAEPIFTASLSGNIESIGTQRDELAKSFSLTRSFVDQNTPLYWEEWNVDRNESLDTSLVSISINGTIHGVGAESGTKTINRFNSASGAYYGTIEALIRPRALEILPTGVCLLETPSSQTLGYNKQAGVITYSHTYDSRFLTDNSNILSESITVSWVLPADIVAEIQIPAKASGPILQDQETVSGQEKSLTIEYTVRQNRASCGSPTIRSNEALAIARAESDILVNNKPSENARGEKPESTSFKTADGIGWNRQEYKFTRNTTWKYT